MADGFSAVESVDGRYSYKLGVIDFITNYGCKKLIENRSKSFIFKVDKNDISAIHPEAYQKRFAKFI